MKTKHLSEKVLSNGVKVFYPIGMRLSRRREEILEESSDRLKKTIRKSVFAIFLNEDESIPGSIRNVNFLFSR